MIDSQATVLRHVRDNPNVPYKILAQQLGINPNTFGVMVMRLIRAGKLQPRVRSRFTRKPTELMERSIRIAARMRADGAMYKDIAPVIGVSRQAVHMLSKRYPQLFWSTYTRAIIRQRRALR
jgi:hypothetical protein